MSLQKNAVSAELLTLLDRLMRAEPLNGFYLVGGTALALRYGHRISVDLDIFTHLPFDASKLAEFLAAECALTEVIVAENTVLGVMSGIKTDFIAHRYPLIAGVQLVEGVRLLATEDIAAMKLNAIANRGSKKDFWDLYELLQHFSRQELLSLYEKKYPQASVWNVEKSLSYFDDADAEPDPVDLRGLTWGQVKTYICESNRL